MTDTTIDDDSAEPSHGLPQKPRRRWIRWVVGCLAVVLVIVATAPYLFRISAVRNLVLNSTLTDFEGTVIVGRAPLGWFTPVRLYDIEVRPPEGPPLMIVPSVEGDVPLWQLVLNRNQLGEFKLNALHVQVLVDESGANFQKLFAPPEPNQGTKSPGGENLSAIRLAVSVALFDGAVTWKGPRSPNGWDVDGIRLQVGLQRRADVPDAVPELVVEAGPLLERASISPEMCEDVLKYAAPALSGATMARGEFSIDLDQWRLPLDRPQDGEMGGRFNIHRIEVGPGPVLESILATIRLLIKDENASRLADTSGSMTIELARDSVVHFEMRDGRVYHHGFELGIGNLRLRTHGSVGLDQTIDIVAEIELPGDALTDRPFLQALASHTIVLPIGGTFAEPRIDAAALGQSSLQAVMGALDALADEESTDEQNVMDILKSTGLLGESNLFSGGPNSESGNSTPDGESAMGNGQVLELWQQWREQRQTNPATSKEIEHGNSGRLLDRLLRRRRAGTAPTDAPVEAAAAKEGSQDPPSDDEAATEKPVDESNDGDTGRRRLFRRRAPSP